MTRYALLGILLLSTIARPVQAEDVKIATVDLRRALAETDEGKKARANLKKIFDQKQKELDERQEEVKKAIEDLNKKKTLLPAETVRQKESELQEQIAKVQQTYLRHQQDLASKEESVTAPLVERLHRIIAKMAERDNLTLVLDRSALIFAKPYLDMTNEVIRKCNAGEEKGAGSSKKTESKKSK